MGIKVIYNLLRDFLEEKFPKVSGLEKKDGGILMVLLPKGLLRIEIKFTSFKEDKEGR